MSHKSWNRSLWEKDTRQAAGPVKARLAEAVVSTALWPCVPEWWVVVQRPQDLHHMKVVLLHICWCTGLSFTMDEGLASDAGGVVFQEMLLLTLDLLPC